VKAQPELEVGRKIALDFLQRNTPK